MTSDPYTTAREVREAGNRAMDDWNVDVRALVWSHRPEWLDAESVTDQRDWLVAVALAQRPAEPAPWAARRLSLYLTLHRERYGEPPTLRWTRNDQPRPDRIT